MSRRVIVQGRAKRGLFHGRHISFGNQHCFSDKKFRRSWKPNVQRKRLWSDLLQKDLRLPVTMHALKCIDKAGGLDSYLLKTKPSILGEGIALELRARLQKVQRTQALQKQDLQSTIGASSTSLPTSSSSSSHQQVRGYSSLSTAAAMGGMNELMMTSEDSSGSNGGNYRPILFDRDGNRIPDMEEEGNRRRFGFIWDPRSDDDDG